MKARMVSVVSVAVLAIALTATIAIGKSASGGTTTQSTSQYDWPGLGCGNDKTNVRESRC
jgi:hypothetical protein